MKSILIFTSSYYPVKGGLQNHIKNLAHSLSDKGYTIHIVTGTDYFPKNFQSKEYIIDGIGITLFKTFSFLGMVFLKNPFDIFKMTKLISNYDIVHQHDIKFLTYSLLIISKIFNKKLFLSSHGFIFHTISNLIFKKVYMKVFSFFSKFYDNIICVSENDFEIAGNYSLSKIRLIDQAVKLEKFLSLNEETKKGNFLYYGRIAPNKGLPDLLLNLSTLKCRDFHLNIVGKGNSDYLEDLKKIILEKHLSSYITIHGEVDEISLFKFISKAEIIFLPSKYEGFGITLLESLASSTKVLANTNRSYCSILRKLNLEELLFDFKEIHNFERKLNEILNKDFLLNQNLYLYSYEHMINQTIEVYERD